MGKKFYRPLFETLKITEKLALMRELADRYGMAFRELYAFSRWGQGLTTGVFEKDGREFVFVPGDTVTLGWEEFAVGMDADSQAELQEAFEEFGYQGTIEAFLRESMSPVRQAAIPPMLVGRRLEEIGWEPVALDDPRLTAHPNWLEEFDRFSSTGGTGLNIYGCARFERVEDRWEAYLYHSVDHEELKRSLQKQGLSLPSVDEWAYLCGGGCRTLFPWGDGMDYAMHLHHYEGAGDERPYDMEEPNFFGLSIAYDPYKREVVEADVLTTCGGDGGCNICGGMGPLLGFLPCSPHCRPETREDNALNIDYDFYRPVVRL